MVYHALFWLCYYAFGALFSLSVHHIYDPRFYIELLSLLPPDMLMVYLNLYLLVPAFLLKRNYPFYFLTILLTMSANAVINIWLHHLYTVSGSPFFAGNSDLTVSNLASQLFNSIYLVGLTSGLKFFEDSMEQRRRIQEQERQQITLELNFLKAQVHPHFFFNTLNNLYSLTLQKSDLAPEVVLKLSSLMSYMLYESSAPLVPLEKEVANLEDYIALEQLRFGNRLSLSFEKEVSTNAPICIPPLILLTFVENSFKHGISQTIGEGRIDIFIKADRDNLQFRINNSIAEAIQLAGSPSNSSADANRSFTPANRPTTPASTNGLGLKNVIRRLDLLYGRNYHFEKSETATHFHVTLKIPLP
jgi:two-component system LytT family sensor kinase